MPALYYVTFSRNKVTYNVHYFTLFTGSEHKVSHKYLKICDKVRVKLVTYFIRKNVSKCIIWDKCMSKSAFYDT